MFLQAVCVFVCVLQQILYECIFLPAVLLEFSCDEACVHGEVSFGDTLVYERLTTKNMCMKERMSDWGRQRGESALCAVHYNLALWFLSRGHVANFPHRRYSFPLLHLSLNPLLHSMLRSNFFWLSPPLIFSSRSDKGGGVWSAKMLTFVYHFGLWMEPISRSNGTRASKTKLQGLVVLLAKGVLQIAIDWHVADLFDFVNQMKKNILKNNKFSPWLSICPQLFHLLLDPRRPQATFCKKKEKNKRYLPLSPVLVLYIQHYPTAFVSLSSLTP